MQRFLEMIVSILSSISILPHTHHTIHVSEEAIKASDTRIDTDFKSGYGTVLFFEDTAVYEAFGAKLGPLMASVFPTWSENSTGILQFSVWTALSNEGLGCSLQVCAHHIPPSLWSLIEIGWSCSILARTLPKPNPKSSRHSTYHPLGR